MPVVMLVLKNSSSMEITSGFNRLMSSSMSVHCPVLSHRSASVTSM